VLSPARNILVPFLAFQEKEMQNARPDEVQEGQRRLYCAGREVGTSGLNSGNVSRNITSIVPYLSNNCAPCYYKISISKIIDSRNKNRGYPNRSELIQEILALPVLSL